MEAEIEKIKMCSFAILRDIKKDIDNRGTAGAVTAAMVEACGTLWRSKTKPAFH